jgi:hypothetical protein
LNQEGVGYAASMEEVEIHVKYLFEDLVGRDPSRRLA